MSASCRNNVLINIGKRENVSQTFSSVKNSENERILFFVNYGYVRPPRRDVKKGMITGAYLDGASVSKTANFLDVSSTTVSRVLTVYKKLDKISLKSIKVSKN